MLPTILPLVAVLGVVVSAGVPRAVPTVDDMSWTPTSTGHRPPRDPSELPRPSRRSQGSNTITSAFREEKKYEGSTVHHGKWPAICSDSSGESHVEKQHLSNVTSPNSMTATSYWTHSPPPCLPRGSQLRLLAGLSCRTGARVREVSEKDVSTPRLFSPAHPCSAQSGFSSAFARYTRSLPGCCIIKRFNLNFGPFSPLNSSSTTNTISRISIEREFARCSTPCSFFPSFFFAPRAGAVSVHMLHALFFMLCSQTGMGRYLFTCIGHQALPETACGPRSPRIWDGMTQPSAGPVVGHRQPADWLQEF
jgi:hypothetical protein